MWTLAAAAWAAPMTLHATPDAEVVALPRRAHERIEIGVYRNRSPIAVEVAKWEAPGLIEARVVNVGGGTAFVVLEVSRSDLVVEVIRNGESREIRLVPGRPVVQEPLQPVSIEVLFAGVPRQPAPLPTDLLLPLLREARQYTLEPREHRLSWEEPHVMRPKFWDETLAPVDKPTQDDLARWREALTVLTEGPLKGVARYRLAMGHRALGFHQEASYYLGLAVSEGFPPANYFVARADAALGSGDWALARATCEEAWYREAPEATVLECLGVVALATDAPSPTAVALALAEVAERPQAKRLAGELFLRDGYAYQAIPLLSAAAKRLPPDQAEAAFIALGDAYVLTDQIELAREAYLSPAHRRHGDMLESRELMIRLLTDGVRRFPAWVPQLTALANRPGPGGADARYLLAQVHEHYIDYDAAAESFAALWDRGVRDGDVADRLLANCAKRIAELGRDKRDAETISIIERCWRDDLAPQVSDVSMLDKGVRAYERLGLVTPALALQVQLTQILAAVDLEDPDSIGRLAHLQTLNGFPDRAIETVAYGRRRTKSPVALARLDLVHGDALAHLERADAAIAQWKLALGHKETATAAQIRIAHLELELGRCTASAMTYADQLRTGPITGTPLGHLELVWARCANLANKPTLALEALVLAVNRSPDDLGKREARWLGNAVALRANLPVPKALESEAGPFSALRDEETAQQAFADRTAAWQRGAR